MTITDRLSDLAPSLRRWGAALTERVELPSRRRSPLPTAGYVPVVIAMLIAATVAAVLAFTFDPVLGRGRRAHARDRVAGTARRIGRRSARAGRWTTATARGLVQRMRSADGPPIDEVALAHRVETELFRDPDIDKGGINVNAERDVVFLRGTAPSEEAIEHIGHRVAGIEGVRRVVNLLHVSGTRADDAQEMSESSSYASGPDAPGSQEPTRTW